MSKDTLRKNEIGRWEVGDLELTSGDSVELLIGSHWIRGNIEFWNGNYHWLRGEVAIILHAGLRVRAFQGRYTDF